MSERTFRRYRSPVPQRSSCSWGIAAGVVASLAGSAMASHSAGNAADASSDAAKNAAAIEERMANANIAMGTPYRQAGYTALAGLMDMAGLSRGTPTPAYNPSGTAGPPGAGTAGPPGAVGDVNSGGGQSPGVRTPPLTGMVDGRQYLPKPPQFKPGDTTPAGFTGSDQEWVNFQNMKYDDPKGFNLMQKQLQQTVVNGRTHSNEKASFIFEDYLNGKGLHGTDTGVGPNSQAAMEAKYDVPNLADKPTYNWQKDPGYEFRLAEGMRGLENSAAARGGLLSGAFAKEAMNYNQNFASHEYQNIFNRVASISGISTSNTGVDGANALTVTQGQAIQNAGDARASGYTGSGNAWQNGLNQVSQLFGSAYGGGPTSQSGWGFDGNGNPTRIRKP